MGLRGFDTAFLFLAAAVNYERRTAQVHRSLCKGCTSNGFAAKAGQTGVFWGGGGGIAPLLVDFRGLDKAASPSGRDSRRILEIADPYGQVGGVLLMLLYRRRSR